MLSDRRARQAQRRGGQAVLGELITDEPSQLRTATSFVLGTSALGTGTLVEPGMFALGSSLLDFGLLAGRAGPANFWLGVSLLDGADRLTAGVTGTDDVLPVRQGPGDVYLGHSILNGGDRLT